MPAVTPIALPTDNDATYADIDPQTKLHQQHHDRLHLLAVGGGINVRDYGATGDGVTDDTAAIQAAWNAIPSTGGTLLFPPGDYLLNGAVGLRPKQSCSVIIQGTHTPSYYGGSNNLAMSCKIRLGASFTGVGLIDCTATGGGDIKGLSFRNIGLVGNGVGTNIHGIRFPDRAAYNGEMSWRFMDVSICGFTGSGMYGNLHVGTITNTYVHNNLRYGIEVAAGTTDHWNDCKIINTYFFYNRMGGCLFAGGVTTAGAVAGSGFVQFTNCRFERSGQVFGFPTNSPTQAGWNADAAGIRLRRASLFTFTSCSTDANTGPGFDVLGEAGGFTASILNNITFTTCVANRDGGGAQTTLPTATTSSGFRVEGVSAAGTDEPNDIHFVGCDTETGGSSDTGGSTVISPAYGGSFENCMGVDWLLGRPTGVTQNMRYGPTDSTWASCFIYNNAGVLVHRNRLGIVAEIGSGMSQHSMWWSDTTAQVANQGAALTTTVTELDSTFGGSRMLASSGDLGVMFQMFILGRVTTALAGATVTITIRDTSNTGNILATLTQSVNAVANFQLMTTWAMRPTWLTGDKTIAVYVAASTGTTAGIVLREVSIRYKGGGA